MKFIGIDIGAKGAFAFIDSESGELQTIPSLKNFILIRDMLERHRLTAIAVIEDLSPVFGSSAAGTMSFGWQVGFVEGILQTLGIQYVKVKPKVWQEAVTVPVVKPRLPPLKKPDIRFKIPTKKEWEATKAARKKELAKINKAHKEAVKQESLRCANEAFPMASIEDHNVADAVNLARYLRYVKRLNIL